MGIKYRVHVQDVGWMPWQADGSKAGTTGQCLRLEAIEIDSDLALEYRCHVENIGWTDWVSNGQTCGTVGQCLKLEALEIKLKDGKDDNVWYRTHSQDVGWMDWAKDGEPAGTEGLNLRAESIQILLLKKDVELKTDSVENYIKKIKEENPDLDFTNGESGVDVSWYQGYDVDWKAVKNSGVTFAILKAIEEHNPDSTFHGNVERARAAGVKVGAYQYIWATSADAARAEARSMIARLKEVAGSFPAGVWADMEQHGIESTANEVIDAWCTELEAAGYKAGFYCNLNWINNYIRDDIKRKWPFWLAQYSSSRGTNANIWQYTDSGRVSGIPGNVDMNIICGSDVEVPPNNGNGLKYFQDWEFSCGCGCGMNVEQELKERLDSVRERLGLPITISSAARCIDFNRQEGGVEGSEHTKGKAADIYTSGMSNAMVDQIADLCLEEGLGVIRYYDWSSNPGGCLFVHAQLDYCDMVI